MHRFSRVTRSRVGTAQIEPFLSISITRSAGPLVDVGRKMGVIGLLKVSRHRLTHHNRHALQDSRARVNNIVEVNIKGNLFVDSEQSLAALAKR